MPALPPPGPLLRPAIIELRYSDSDRYREAVKLYRGLLRTRYEDSVGDKVHTFRIGQSQELDKKDLLLRLTWQASNLRPEDGHTVVYWKIRGVEAEKLDSVDRVLQQERWVSVDAPDTYDVRPEPPKGTARRSLLRHEVTGDLMGLTINPPVPTVETTNPEFVKQLAAFLNSLGFASDGGLQQALRAALASGLVLAGLIFGLGWWLRGKLSLPGKLPRKPLA